MSDDPFVGTIVPVAFGFAPVGWLPCDGRLLDISEYQLLYTVIGTTYGGDGVSQFALPNLSGAVALGAGSGPRLSSYAVGETGGVESVTLTASHLPSHSHTMVATVSTGTKNIPNSNAVVAASGQASLPFSTAVPSITMSGQALAPTAGGGQPHENRQPALCLNYIIATAGLFPQQA